LEIPFFVVLTGFYELRIYDNTLRPP